MRSTVPALGLALVISAVVYGSTRVLSSPEPPVVASIASADVPVAPALIAVASAPAPPPARVAARPGEGSIASHVRAAAHRYGVPESLVAAVASVESEFNPRAVSRRGALGLMQLMPGTAALLGVRDAFDPRENIDAGARHLRDLLEQFANDVSLALAAYNAGAQAVIKHGGIPPYPETRAFVARVLDRASRMTMPAFAVTHASSPAAPAPRVRFARLTTERMRRDDGDTVMLATTPEDVRVAPELPTPPRESVQIVPVSVSATTPVEATIRVEAP